MVRGKLKKVAGSLVLGVGLMSGSVMAGDVVEPVKCAAHQDAVVVGRDRGLDAFRQVTPLLEGAHFAYEIVIDGIDDTFYGDELMEAGLQLNRYRQNQHPSDFSSIVYKLTRV